MFVEWQIGYDVLKNNENEELTTLTEFSFTAANGKEKYLYELSEIFYYFVKWGLINKEEVNNLEKYLKNISNQDLIENNDKIIITRSNFKKEEILEINFLKTQISYPLLVYKFDNFEIVLEIVIKEKQRAIGIMPMLYVCFPITEFNENLLGRCADKKETANFVFDENNKNLILETLKIFGILSENHHNDILQILKLVSEKCNKNI
jgi:hypothetical protein